MPALTIRPATPDDLATLQPLIRRAYRGDSARAGWTHEADLLEGERIGSDELAAMVAASTERLLLAFERDRMIGCVRVADLGGGLAYLGLLCIDPLLQARGYGKQLIAAAEATARDEFNADRIEMTVIESRRELIDYYLRRGYVATAERRDFPVPLDPSLFMTVLEKPLR
ncbi:MAG TPA: GNAT family N-acetyltransferase [Sphingomonas sp.]|nr:GNAT family N-acetyltransferase [Sphingomonas sp.]HEX4693435.1 GNAT family N-acetyltransferase [Sphingomonas sp.]